jgi:hypothetical protein
MIRPEKRRKNKEKLDRWYGKAELRKRLVCMNTLFMLILYLSTRINF